MTGRPYDDQEGPNAEDVAKWEEAVAIVRAEHPDWTDATIASAIAYAVMTPEVVEAVEEAAAAHQIAVEAWTAVIRDLQARFPEWSEQECNDNLINLLRWSATQEPSAPEQKIADRPRFGPR